METVFSEYVALRIAGTRPAAALEALRERIETMAPVDKLALVRAVKHYEEQAPQTVTAPFRPTSSLAPSLFDENDPNAPNVDELAALAAASGESTIKLPENLRKKGEAAAAPEPVADDEVPGDPHYTSCPNCGNPVLVSLLQCPTCYFVMPAAGPPVAADATPQPEPPSATYGPSTTLVLAGRDGRRLHSRPQDSRRETIVGRTDGKTFTADLDLSPLGAADLGVSRVHAALVYDADRSVLTIMDMNSMNGTFLNGLRLQPQDVHDLRPGDQLKLGRLALRVTYENR